MAFPGTYNFNYYKGDTYEFNIYPKKNDGSIFNLEPYYDLSGETARFIFSTARGAAGISNQVECFAQISNDNTYIKCAIRPDDSEEMVAGTTYVYDVQITRPATSETNNYPVVQTLLTGTITVTDDVTGAV